MTGDERPKSRLEPSKAGMPDLEVLRQRFAELGFDLTTMPGITFDEAIAAFSEAFIQQAANDPALRDILDSQKINTIDENVVALLKGQDQLLARLERPLKAYRKNSLPRSAKHANAAQIQQETPVRYIGLSVAEQVSTFALQYLRIFELPPSERKSLTLTTSEVVLPVEELETIISWLPKLAQAFSKEGPQQRHALQSFLAAEIAPAVMEATQLRQRGQTRPLSPLAEETSRAGIRYLVLGLTPPIAELVETLRAAVNAGEASKVERASTEVYFASYEDFQSAFSHLQQFLAQAQQMVSA